jgi:hypothetical protein
MWIVCAVSDEEAPQLSASLDTNPAAMAEAVDVTADVCQVVRSIADCSVIVGLHPDQGLNAIVDLARVLGKPVAVVPCCVFAKEFPRRLRCKKAVTTYEDMLIWVAQQLGGVQQTCLPVAGKNALLYTLPS